MRRVGRVVHRWGVRVRQKRGPVEGGMERRELGWTRREFGAGLIVGAAAALAGNRIARGAPPADHVVNPREKTPELEGAAFVRDQARRIVESARLRAGETAGGYRNATAYDMHVPGGNMGYPAFWVRDAVMMLGGDLISAGEVEGWIRLICSTLRGPGAWEVRPGVVVPAYAAPDHINFDGRATFYPGNYETGEKQGGSPWGKYPPLDDHFYFLGAVHEQWRLTGDLGLWRGGVVTGAGEERLGEVCEKVYAVAPCDEGTGLVVAGDVERENAKDWGFCDSVFKSGKLLFPSVLKRRAALQMAEVCEAAGEAARARRYREDAQRIAEGLAGTFYRESAAAGEGWLHSATGVGNQPDVWGSALALHTGAVEGEMALSVSRALVRGFEEKTAAREGLVRHILTNDPKNDGAWERSISEKGEYQNGGWWGTPTGWYIAGMHRTDAGAAKRMAGEFAAWLKGNLREDGTTQAWEWVNPERGRFVNPLYAATVGLPYVSVKEARLEEVWGGGEGTGH